MASIRVFVNETSSDPGVAILLEYPELVEFDGNLQPLIELTPQHALTLAKALSEFAWKAHKLNQK
jgi:hypothetical protein